MALRINTNVASIFAQKHLSRSQERLTSNFEHLSSGLRITKASDDAAGLGVSESMRSQIRSRRRQPANLKSDRPAPRRWRPPRGSLVRLWRSGSGS